MTGFRIVPPGIAGTVVFLPWLAWAQAGSTGAIGGVARDATGAVLPGVTVEAASPALIEKVRVAVTDDQGRYLITDLRPGPYAVTFSLTGFSSLRREGIEITTGFTATANADLRIGVLEETVTVTGASPVVDVQNVRTQTAVGREVLDDIPGARTLAGLAKLTVGATGGTNDVGGNKGEGSVGTIHGTGAGQTMVDGLRITNPVATGTARRQAINQLSVEEVVLEYAGAYAESESGGFNVNFVTKSGGNTLSGAFSGDLSGERFQANNISSDLRNRGVRTSPKLRHIYDAGIGIGGPIRRDRLWFYTSHRWWGVQEEVPNSFFNRTQDTVFYTPDTARPAFTDTTNFNSDGKITWQLSASHKLLVAAQTSRVCTPCYSQGLASATGVATSTAPEASIHVKFWPQYAVQVGWASPMSPRLLLEATVVQRVDHKNYAVPDETGNARSVVEQSTNFMYGSSLIGPRGPTFWANDYGHHGNSNSLVGRAAVSFVTGSHAFKAGVNGWSGNSAVGGAPLHNVQYVFRNQIPVSLYQVAGPNFYDSRVRMNLGIFAQDQWSIRRLTINAGLRYDNLNAYNPEQTRPGGEFLPAIRFPEQRDVPNWKDVNPRVGAAYDLFGTSRTALKVSVGRYITLDSLTIAARTSSAAALSSGTTRTWNDALFGGADRRTGNYVPDCDLTSPLANGECGPMSNRSFGTSVITTRYSDDVTRGWGVRPYNWQASVSIQHELRPNVGVMVGYFRTWYGNFTVTDNLALQPADFNEYCITTPTDARLPGGGGQRLCGLYDLHPSRFGLTDNLVRQASDFGRQAQVFNGVDAVVNARIGTRGFVTGGVSSGRTTTDDCGVRPDSPQAIFCESSSPETQFKVAGSYQLPWGLQASGSVMNVRGIAVLASHVVTNAQVAPSLGRNLGQCGTQAACTATVVVPALIEPHAVQEPRQTVADVRISRVFRVARYKIEPKLDVYNLFNANNVLGITSRYGPAWTQPTSILAGRLVKFGVQMDF